MSAADRLDALAMVYAYLQYPLGWTLQRGSSDQRWRLIIQLPATDLGPYSPVAKRWLSDPMLPGRAALICSNGIVVASAPYDLPPLAEIEIGRLLVREGIGAPWLPLCATCPHSRHALDGVCRELDCLVEQTRVCSKHTAEENKRDTVERQTRTLLSAKQHRMPHEYTVVEGGTGIPVIMYLPDVDGRIRRHYKGALRRAHSAMKEVTADEIYTAVTALLGDAATGVLLLQTDTPTALQLLDNAIQIVLRQQQPPAPWSEVLAVMPDVTFGTALQLESHYRPGMLAGCIAEMEEVAPAAFVEQSRQLGRILWLRAQPLQRQMEALGLYNAWLAAQDALTNAAGGAQ